MHDVQALLAINFEALNQNGLPHWFQDFQRPALEVLERAAAWVDEPDPRPWFCLVNLYDVHWPYVPEGESRERWVDEYSGPVDGYLKRGASYRAHAEELKADPDAPRPDNDGMHVTQ